jgi:hypothetical protein
MTDIGGSFNLSMEDTFGRNCKQYGGIFSAEERKSNGLRNCHACTEAFPAEARQAVRLLSIRKRLDQSFKVNSFARCHFGLGEDASSAKKEQSVLNRSCAGMGYTLAYRVFSDLLQSAFRTPRFGFTERG